ncbi:uncharacterized protein LOC115445016 [Manduca sexta]|uniref:Single domain major allergen protein n=1 Tax=Manduca sexta TaxID=7130 RepID=A0A921Z7Y1_MANSE|nr:uncharacterized protein LOC115445016 [Manduca sexta]KAG6452456.1 hypothetical protein O3G_MSEX007629 [Manduca sexta]
MKVALVVLALISLGCAAPQPRKVFHEHFEDFVDVIVEEVGDELMHLTGHYLEYDDFWVAFNYLKSESFRNLVDEFESLPEFAAVVEFLENDNIDIRFFIDMFHEFIDELESMSRPVARHATSGTNFSAYINDVIATFPKAKLAALYDEKMANDEEFRVAMENLLSPEWDAVLEALWTSDVFQAEIKTLAEYGIDASVLYLEILAIFGQNRM